MKGTSPVTEDEARKKGYGNEIEIVSGLTEEIEEERIIMQGTGVQCYQRQ